MSVESSLSPKGSKRIKRRARLMTPHISARDKAARASATSEPNEVKEAVAEAAQSSGYSVGDRVAFDADGFVGSGVVDDVMPDGSVMWVWPDDGMGRRMLCVSDTVRVTHEWLPAP
jgi:hypothetical protein